MPPDGVKALAAMAACTSSCGITMPIGIGAASFIEIRVSGGRIESFGAEKDVRRKGIHLILGQSPSALATDPT